MWGLVTGRFVVGKMAAQWKNFKTQMKEKRAGKRKAPSHDILQKEVIIIPIAQTSSITLSLGGLVQFINAIQ